MHELSMRLMRRLARWQQLRAEKRLQRRALEIAMGRFSKLHAHWYGSCFDLFFIERIPSSSLARFDAATLAQEWTRQFRYRDERQRAIDVRQLTPVAESFLCLLESARAELTREPEGRSDTAMSGQRGTATGADCRGALSE